MALKLETPEGMDALSEFILFQDRVYQSRSARWPVLVPLLLGDVLYEPGSQMQYARRSRSQTVHGTPSLNRHRSIAIGTVAKPTR